MNPAETKAIVTDVTIDEAQIFENKKKNFNSLCGVAFVCIPRVTKIV